MQWINVLHFYQPANIEREKLLAATEQSYERILRALEEHSELHFTINLSGCLVDRWVTEFDRTDLIDRFKKLIKTGRVELVGSAAYHCLLPLVSPREAEWQIKEQENILRKYFGKNLKIKGFFLPELAYSPKISKLLKKLGYEWLIVDQIALGGVIIDPSTGGYIDQASGMKVLLRNRLASESYVPDTIQAALDDPSGKKIYITASDAELYGLHYIDHTANFETLVKNKNLKTVTVSSYIKKIRNFQKKKFLECSWQSTEQELAQGLPYPLWNGPDNQIHKKLWELADLAQNLNFKHKNSKAIAWSRWHLVRGLASCAWWWSSRKDFSDVFGPIAWSPDEIEKGINELIRSIRSLEDKTDLKTKLLAEKLAADLRKDIWQTHWQK